MTVLTTGKERQGERGEGGREGGRGAHTEGETERSLEDEDNEFV